MDDVSDLFSLPKCSSRCFITMYVLSTDTSKSHDYWKHFKVPTGRLLRGLESVEFSLKNSVFGNSHLW